MSVHLRSWSLALVASGALTSMGAGCAGSAHGEIAAHAEANVRSKAVSGGDQSKETNDRCKGGPDREVSQYDTNGDNIPDVRKVFKREGTGPDARLVLICREADLNGDGVKDVVRYYDDEGSPIREEADRNFDGKMDTITYYEGGNIIRQEIDTNGNGKIDMKVFFENGKPIRAERDRAGRSTPGHWKPDTWEYYEDGRLVRVGVDVNGDGQVDRWDRNEALSKEIEAKQAKEKKEAGQGQDNGNSGDSGDSG